MSHYLKGLPVEEDENARMARLIERDEEEQEQRDLILDMRDRDLPIFAALAWTSRPAPGSEPLPGSPFSSPWDTTTRPGGDSSPVALPGPSSPASEDGRPDRCRAVGRHTHERN